MTIEAMQNDDHQLSATENCAPTTDVGEGGGGGGACHAPDFQNGRNCTAIPIPPGAVDVNTRVDIAARVNARVDAPACARPPPEPALST